VVTCNMTNVIDADATDSRQLTAAHVACRRQLDTIVAFLRKCVPGFEKCYLMSTASLVGVRETRHFEGEATLAAEDILEARAFDDWVVPSARFNFDIHNLDGSGLDKDGAQKHFPQNRPYTIPYGCLVPKKIDQLLLAGRSISGTHKAHSNYRVMPICLNIGQAAGAAAAIAVKSGRTVREVPAAEIQKHLLAHGAAEPRGPKA